MCDFRQPPPYIILPDGTKVDDSWMGSAGIYIKPESESKWGFGPDDLDTSRMEPGLYYLAHGYVYWSGKDWIYSNPWIDERPVDYPTWTCPDWDGNDTFGLSGSTPRREPKKRTT